MEHAKDRNTWATHALVAAGRNLGYHVETEHEVPGWRIDVVWLVEAPFLEGLLPLVGFEIESSWRTRKHVKGDILNLQDLSPALGVIALLGEGDKVESLRRFAVDAVDRTATRILIWSESDIERLESASGSIRPRTPTASPTATAPSDRDRPARATVPEDPGRYTGKYRDLWQWLRQQRNPSVTVSFDEVEAILGKPLPNSARDHLSHWYGYEGTALGKAIRVAGWRATDVNLTAEQVTFVRETG